VAIFLCGFSTTSLWGCESVFKLYSSGLDEVAIVIRNTLQQRPDDAAVMYTVFGAVYTCGIQRASISCSHAILSRKPTVTGQTRKDVRRDSLYVDQQRRVKANGEPATPSTECHNFSVSLY